MCGYITTAVAHAGRRSSAAGSESRVRDREIGHEHERDERHGDLAPERKLGRAQTPSGASAGAGARRGGGAPGIPQAASPKAVEMAVRLRGEGVIGRRPRAGARRQEQRPRPQSPERQRGEELREGVERVQRRARGAVDDEESSARGGPAARRRQRLGVLVRDPREAAVHVHAREDAHDLEAHAAARVVVDGAPPPARGHEPPERSQCPSVSKKGAYAIIAGEKMPRLMSSAMPPWNAVSPTMASPAPSAAARGRAGRTASPTRRRACRA